MKNRYRLVLLSFFWNFFLPIFGSYFSRDYGNYKKINLHIDKKHKSIALAIKNGGLEETKKIFEEKNFKIEPDRPLMQMAIYWNKPEIVQYFLDQGASANEPYFLETTKYEYRGPFWDKKIVKKHFDWPLSLIECAPKSGIVQLLIEKGAGIPDNAVRVAAENNDIDALRFLLQKAGAPDGITHLRYMCLPYEPHTETTKLIKEILGKNDKARKTHENDPKGLIKSDAFAFWKLKALETLMKKPKNHPGTNWPEIFKNFWFSRNFFAQKNAARFANTHDLRDCDGNTVPDALLKAPVLFLGHPEFTQTVITTAAWQHKGGLLDFCKIILGVTEPKQTESPSLSQLLKTKKMAKRLYKIYKESEADKFAERSQTFGLSLINNTIIFHSFFKNYGLPSEMAYEITRFSDGNFGKKLLLKPSFDKKVEEKKCIIS